MPASISTVEQLGDNLGVRRDRQGFGGFLGDYIDRRAGRLAGDYDTRVARALAIKNLLDEKQAREAGRNALLRDAALTGVDAAPAERAAFSPDTGFDLPLPPSGAADFAANEQATFNTLSRELALDQAVEKNEPRVQALRRAFALSDSGIEPNDVRTGALLDATNATRGNPFVGADIGNDKSVFESSLEPVSIADPATGNIRQVYAIRTTTGVRADGGVDFSFEPARTASGDFLDVPPEALVAGRASGGRGGVGGSKPTAGQREADDLVAGGFYKTRAEALFAIKRLGVDGAKQRALIALRLAGQEGFGQDVERVRSTIDRFEEAARPPPRVSPDGATATDPTTGRKIIKVNGRWQEVR